MEKAKAELTKMIAELCSEMEELFTSSFKEINRHFGHIFRELFGGGHARLYLSDENNVLESGIEIEVSPAGQGHQEPQRPVGRRAGPGGHLHLFLPSST